MAAAVSLSPVSPSAQKNYGNPYSQSRTHSEKRLTGVFQACVAVDRQVFREEDPLAQRSVAVVTHLAPSLTLQHGSNVKSIDISLQVHNSNITKRLSEDEKAELIIALMQTGDQPVNDLVEAVKKETWWKESIFDDPRFPQYALLALMQGLISENDFFTLVSYAELIDLYGKDQVQCHVVADGGWAKEAIKSTFPRVKYVTDPSSIPPLAGEILEIDHKEEPILIEDQQQRFFTKLKTRSSIAQTVFVIVDPETEESRKNIRSAIAERSQFNMISRCMLDGCKTSVLHGSSEMWEIILEELDGGITMNRVLGCALPEHFHDPNSRIVGYGCRSLGCTGRTTADGYPAKGSFTFHDRYHCSVVATIPKEIRQLLISAAEVVQGKIAGAVAERQVAWLCQLYESLLDMDWQISSGSDPYQMCLQYLMGCVELACSRFAGGVRFTEREMPFMYQCMGQLARHFSIPNIKTHAKEFREKVLGLIDLSDPRIHPVVQQQCQLQSALLRVMLQQ